MDTRFKECVEFYGEDVKSATPESFLGIFKSFFTNFANARKDNEAEAGSKRKNEERIKKEAAKAIEKEAQKAVDEARIVERKQSEEGILDNGDRKGVMDDLISSLKTGDAFRGKTRRRAPVNLMR
jgi:hypothetical protein